MPSGVVHAQASLFLAFPACALAYGTSAHLPPQDAMFHAGAAALGCLAGIPLSPDLDQEGLSTTEHWIIKMTLGLGFLWTMLWYPYARLCKHRSPLSHWPILGTAGRLAYIGIFVGIALACGWQPPVISLAPVLWALFGLMLSDTAHWAMDTKWGDKHKRRRG